MSQAMSRPPRHLSSPAEVMRQHRGASWLTVYAGRRRIGLVVDTRSPRRGTPPAPSYAFDAEDRPLGEFSTRRLAMAAVTARDEFELHRHVEAGA